MIVALFAMPGEKTASSVSNQTPSSFGFHTAITKEISFSTLTPLLYRDAKHNKTKG